MSEVHLCADVAGWELSLEDATAFISRGHQRKTHLDLPDNVDSSEEPATELPAIEVNMDGQALYRL